MHAPTPSAKSVSCQSDRRSPRTISTPQATSTTPTACSNNAPPPATSTNTGAEPRASGYTADSSYFEYASARSAKYASSNPEEAITYGHTPAEMSPARAGRNSTQPTHIPTAVAAWES